MSPYIAFEIFKHQPSREKKQHGRFGTRSTMRLGKLIVRRLSRRIRHAVNAVARPGDAPGAGKRIQKPATEGPAR